MKGRSLSPLRSVSVAVMITVGSLPVVLGCRCEPPPQCPDCGRQEASHAVPLEPPPRPSSPARSTGQDEVPPIRWAAYPPRERIVSRVAFGSCASQYRPQPIWDRVAHAGPDLFLHLGDIIYIDRPAPPSFDGVPNPTVLQKARFDYGVLASHDEFRRFAEKTPMMLIWDDHDFGKNDAGAEFEHKEETKRAFLEFVGADDKDERRTRPGLYQARTFGPAGKRLQVILLDTRTFRSPLSKDMRSDDEKKKLGIVGVYRPHTDPNTTLLGSTQWDWLERQLEQPAEVRLIGSSIQVVASEKGIESWGNFPHERAHLYSLIEKTQAHGVLFLSGDVHFAELSRTQDGPYPLYDFTSSNLAHPPSDWGKDFVNSHRVDGPIGEQNFGWVEVDWEHRPLPRIVMRIIDSTGTSRTKTSIDLAELRVPARTP